MSIYFQEQTSPDIQAASERKTLILIPVGQVEEHGPHLPLDTDCIIASETARAVAEQLKDEIPVLVLPTVWTAYSVRQVGKWHGLISFRQPETMIQLVFDILASLVHDGFTKIVLINGHGNNPAILELACRRIGDEFNVFPAVTFVIGMTKNVGPQVRKSAMGGCGEHAGEVETAMLLHLRPELVHMDKATNDDLVTYRTRFFPGDVYSAIPNRVSGIFWSTWGVFEPKTGVLGDPTVATAETGKALFDEAVAQHVAFLQEYYAHS